MIQLSELSTLSIIVPLRVIKCLHDRDNEILFFIAVELIRVIWEALYHDEKNTDFGSRISTVQWLSHVQPFAAPWTAARSTVIAGVIFFFFFFFYF